MKPGKASKAPIVVGFINDEGGPGSAPELNVVTAEAVRTVNDILGGINGHPIRLNFCQPADAAQAQNCANQFAGDAKMVAAMQGIVDTDTSAFHATMTPRIPVLGMAPLSTADAAAGNSYYMASGQFGGLGLATYARDFGRAKKVSLLSATGFAAADLAHNTVRTMLQDFDIAVTPATFRYDQKDLTSAVLASGAATADLVLATITTPQQCVNLATALNDLGITTPVATFANCLGTQIHRQLGDYPRWHYLSFSVSAEASSANDLTAWQVRAFNEWFVPLDIIGVTRAAGVQMFQTVLALVKILSSIPEEQLNAQTAADGMRKFAGPVFLGVPKVGFGSVPSMPSIGSLACRVYAYFGSDTWRDATGGKWMDPPPPAVESKARSTGPRR